MSSKDGMGDGGERFKKGRERKEKLDGKEGGEDWEEIKMKSWYNQVVKTNSTVCCSLNTTGR